MPGADCRRWFQPATQVAKVDAGCRGAARVGWLSYKVRIMYELADRVWQLPLVPRDTINAYLIRECSWIPIAGRYEPGIASALLAGDGLGVGGGQVLGRARASARRRGHPEVLDTQLGHEVLPERRSAIGQ